MSFRQSLPCFPPGLASNGPKALGVIADDNQVFGSFVLIRDEDNEPGSWFGRYSPIISHISSLELGLGLSLRALEVNSAFHGLPLG